METPKILIIEENRRIVDQLGQLLMEITKGKEKCEKQTNQVTGVFSACKKQVQPKVVICGLNCHTIPGIGIITFLLEQGFKGKIIAFSPNGCEERAITAGADFFLKIQSDRDFFNRWELKKALQSCL